MIGKAAFLGEESSPAKSSRFISKPTRKKNMAINPSLIQSMIGLVRLNVSAPTVKSCFQNDS